MAASLVALAVAGGYGAWRIARVEQRQRAAPHLAIGIAQPNVGEIELHANPDASVRTLQDETAELYAKHADLVVWPEVGFNTRAVRWNEPRALDIRGGVPMPRIAGVIRVAPGQIWNSAIVVGREQK